VKKLDAEALYVALDKRRRQLAREQATRISWREVARELGISQSTFTRLGMHNRPPNTDILVLLLGWLGETDLAPYLTEPTEETRDARP
jgi:transcriptional regulator with XRE-family HTH domain